jgi:glycosyltransferase involved in cell wall biosynthesis
VKWRVLVLIKGLGRGGAEQLLVDGLAHADHSRFRYDVAYVLPHKSALAGALRAEGVTVRCLGSGPSWFNALRRLVRTTKPDVIHAHLPTTGIAARLLGRGHRVKQVYTEHNVWQSYRRTTMWANAATLPLVDHVFAVSREVADSVATPPFARRIGWPPVETLRHGLDLARVRHIADADGIRGELGIPNGSPVVTSIANFRKEKGHTTLLDAATIVRDAVPDARFLLVGQGQLEGEIRAVAARRGLLDGTLMFCGSRDDAPRVARASDVVVLASDYEGLPVSLLEAMAVGVPAAATTVGGIPEVVRDGREGLLVPPRDPRALADAIVRLLGDRRLRERLGSSAARRAEDFSIEHAVRRIEQVYEGLLA